MPRRPGVPISSCRDAQPDSTWRARPDRVGPEAAKFVALESAAPEAAKVWLLLGHAYAGRPLSVRQLTRLCCCGGNVRAVGMAVQALHGLGLVHPVRASTEPAPTGDDDA